VLLPAPEAFDVLEDASGFFMTGGSQLRISSALGGTPLADLLRRRHAEGMVVAGTSAGAVSRLRTFSRQAATAASADARDTSSTAPAPARRRLGPVRRRESRSFIAVSRAGEESTTDSDRLRPFRGIVFPCFNPDAFDAADDPFRRAPRAPRP
jgi:hypothetical protein